MSYRRSIPLEQWLGVRRQSINTLAHPHAAMSAFAGSGGPLEARRPVGQAYVLRVVSEFQAFVRDLHGLTAERIIDLAGAQPQFQSLLIAAATEGRQVDRGNAGRSTMAADFRRFGIGSLDGEIGARNAYWRKTPTRRGDRAFYDDLIALRNALAHGNQRQVQLLGQRGVKDTITWARDRLPGLDRLARALDRVVWIMC